MTPRTFSLTVEDIIDAWLAKRRGSWQAKLILIASILVASLAALACWMMLQAPPPHDYGEIVQMIAVAIMIPGVWLLTRWVIWPLNARRMIKQQKGFSRPIEVSWTEEQITLEQGENRSRIAWKDFFRWTEHERVIVLFQNYALMSVLPKRAFSEADLAELREFATRAGLPMQAQQRARS